MKHLFVLLLGFMLTQQLSAANHTTKHFDFKSNAVDSTVLVELGDTLENNYNRITTSLSIELSQKITVNVYKDLSTYHSAIGKPGSPDWMVGNAVDSSIIHMVSPDNPGPAHSKESLLRVIIHEFTHNCIIVAGKGKYPPIWLNEATAVYYARQSLSKIRARQLYKDNNNKVPTISNLSTDFNGNDGYQWGYTIVHYIIDTYNGDSLSKFLQYPSSWSIVGALNQSDFDKKWHEFVIENYIKANWVNVTFQVDMNWHLSPIDAVTIQGSFNNWCLDCDTLFDSDNDGIYTTTLKLDSFENYDYRYIYYPIKNKPGNSENLDTSLACAYGDPGSAYRVLKQTKDTVLSPVCFNACKACAEPKKVTLKVDLNEFTKTIDKVVARGNFNDWELDHEMEDKDNDGIYETTLELQENYELIWRFYVTGSNQREWFDANATCTDALTGNARYHKVLADTTLPTYCFGSCQPCQNTPTSAFVTLKVDMNNHLFDKTIGVHAYGNFNEWCRTCDKLKDDDNDGIYEVTVEAPIGRMVWKYFANGSEFLDEDASCIWVAGGFANRYLDVKGDTTLPIVCYGTCSSCNTIYQANFANEKWNGLNTFDALGDQGWNITTTFGDPAPSAMISGFDSGSRYANEDWLITPLLDLSGYRKVGFSFSEAINFTGSTPVSTYNQVLISTDYSGTGDPNNATWTELTMPKRAAGNNWDFVFSDTLALDDYAGKEKVSIAFKYTSSNQYTPTWEVDNIHLKGSNSGPNPDIAKVTFKVDMQDYLRNYQKVYLNGNLNNWCGDCNEMLDPDNDQVYEITMPLQIGFELEYKFTVDAWNDQEEFTPGMPCTRTSGPYTNRYLLVEETNSLEPVCWMSCNGCQTVGMVSPQSQFAIYPNPNNGSFTLSADLSMPSTVSIISIDGKTVYQKQVQQSGTLQLPIELELSGTYIVRLVNNKGVSQKMVVVQE